MTCEIPGVDGQEDMSVLTTPFAVTVGWFGQPWIIKNSALQSEVDFLKLALGAYRPDSEFYQRKLPAGPDMVAMSTDFIQVTFTGSFEVATQYVAWLNAVYAGLIVPA